MLVAKKALEEARRLKAEELDARRRAQFVAAAIREFGRRGYHETTTGHIAKRANVSTGLLYHYFKDKEDLLFYALMGILDLYKSDLPKAIAEQDAPLDRFIAAVRTYCKVIDGNPEATVLAYRETASLSQARRNIIKQKETETNKIIEICIRDCIRAGVFDQIDVELFTYQVVMFCHAWALKAWRFRSQMGVEEYLDRGLDLMLRGISRAEEARRSRPRKVSTR
jgi:TetR/AcrR family transcriptional regulator, cholesterol catabolism regulator